MVTTKLKMSELKRFIKEELTLADAKDMLDGAGNRLRTISREMRRAFEENDEAFIESSLNELEDIADLIGHVHDQSVRTIHYRPRAFHPKKPPPKYYDQGVKESLTREEALEYKTLDDETSAGLRLPAAFTYAERTHQDGELRAKKARMNDLIRKAGARNLSDMEAIVARLVNSR